MAYSIASTFSDKTAFQGWEMQRHTLPGPQESIQAWVVCFLAFVSVRLGLHASVGFGALALHVWETLKCQLLRRPQG